MQKLATAYVYVQVLATAYVYVQVLAKAYLYISSGSRYWPAFALECR